MVERADGGRPFQQCVGDVQAKEPNAHCEKLYYLGVSENGETGYLSWEIPNSRHFGPKDTGLRVYGSGLQL